MPKFVVGLTETTFFSIPIEAENAQEAEQKARAILATTECGADYVCVELSEQFDGDPPNPDEVDDACFERFGGVAA